MYTFSSRNPAWKIQRGYRLYIIQNNNGWYRLDGWPLSGLKSSGKMSNVHNEQYTHTVRFNVAHDKYVIYNTYYMAVWLYVLNLSGKTNGGDTLSACLQGLTGWISTHEGSITLQIQSDTDLKNGCDSNLQDDCINMLQLKLINQIF